ncbi:MAG: hypothetical protein IT379_27395 [Deltaproteobacteria bacterium]|nr:hypothetical protein [Deltaproteobacteria bacterium]
MASSRSVTFRDARVGAATTAAAMLVAQQVIGKALRDTLFIATFGVELLPYAMLTSAVVTGVLVAVMARVVVRRTPRSLAMATMLASAALLTASWVTASIAPAAAAALTYLHTGALTAASASVLWTHVSESFDPYAARGAVPRIMGGATLGGVLGGLVTWRVAALVEPRHLLLLAAALNLAAVLALRQLRAPERRRHAAPERLPWSAFARELPFLRAIAALVSIAAVSQAVLDYLLSAAAVDALGRGAQLLSFFALFQTGVGVLSFLVQISASRGALERFGVGRVLAVPPLAVVAGTLLTIVAPPLGAAVVLRGADGALGASLQRSAYEVLFAPLDAAKRRACKPVLDVAVDRAGTLLGGGLVAAVIAIGGTHVAAILTVVAGALALARLLLTPALQRGYRRALADGLRHGRLEMSGSGVLDPATVGELSKVVAGGRESLLREIDRFERAKERLPMAPGGLSLAAFDLPGGPALDAYDVDHADDDARGETHDDAVVAALRDLRSAQPERARAALAVRPCEPILAPQVIALLANDDLAQSAADWLSAQEPPAVGLLADALLGDAIPPAARRRVARVLAKLDDPRTDECLLGALDRVPSSVRLGVAQALARVATRRRLPRPRLLLAMTHAATVGGSDGADRSSRAEEIFELLAAAYPKEPVRAASRALARADEHRGIALEWLDVLLPHDVKAVVWPVLVTDGGGPSAHGAREGARTVEELRKLLESQPAPPSDREQAE